MFGGQKHGKRMRYAREVAVLMMLLTVVPGSQADPLPPETCTELNAQREKLISLGIASDMERGAEWAKANLPPERLHLIQALIETEEQLSFRCGQLVTARPTLLKPKPPPASAPAPAVAPADDAAPVQPVKKKKKRIKAADAFVPPEAAAPVPQADPPPPAASEGVTSPRQGLQGLGD